jgi:hypothetical protein
MMMSKGIRANNIAYRNLRDGDVLFGEDIEVLNRETEID